MLLSHVKVVINYKVSCVQR